MVAAVRYFATPDDHSALLNYLDEPITVSLHPWPIATNPLEGLDRATALESAQVMVVHRLLGLPVVMRPGAKAMAEPSKAGIFNRMNWERLRPAPREGLVDSNASPVLFWHPGKASEDVLSVGHIGSQADSMAAISLEYEQWVNRVMGWVRRHGTKVWGERRAEVRPDLDIDLHFVNAVYALPRALESLEAGTPGR